MKACKLKPRENFIRLNILVNSMHGGYKAKYADYRFRLDWTSSEPFDPENEMIDVRLQTLDGQEYFANFTTEKYIREAFEKNKRTGECASGTYFCMPGNMIILEKLTEEDVRKTIDNLIENEEVECYFKKAD